MSHGLPLIAQLADDVKPHVRSALDFDAKTLLYLSGAMLVGSLSSVAALLADETRAVTRRLLFAYFALGAVASLGVVALLMEKYGSSYFLIGVAVFASYKAVDILASISLAITALVKKFIGSGDK